MTMLVCGDCPKSEALQATACFVRCSVTGGFYTTWHQCHVSPTNAETRDERLTNIEDRLTALEWRAKP